MRSHGVGFRLLPLTLLGSLFLVACGHTGPAKFSSGGSGNLSVAVSATNTCAALAGGPAGPYSHIYLSISDVQASPNANATPGDGSFVDVTPGLKSAPKLVDLLGTPNQCAVATLASNLSLATGTYQQFRVLLAADGSGPAGSPCGTFANCVILSGDATNTPHDLQVGTETTQGIAIGTGQISGGSFSPTGQAQVLNLAFNSCASVIALSSTQFRLKPVVMAGDATGAPSVSGQLVDSATMQPVPSGQFLVALEAPDSLLVDRVWMDTRADANGNFNLCPVMGGPYDVVASGLRTDNGTSYAATATLGVTPGAQLGVVPMLAVSGSPSTATSVMGSVNTSATAGQPVSADVSVSALQANGSGSAVMTVPPLNAFASTANVATQPGSSCPSGTDCTSFSMLLPAASPVVGIFSASGTPYLQNGAVPSFRMAGDAFAPLSGATPFCSPSTQSVTANGLTPGGVIDLTPTPLSFVTCQ